jgi:proton-dependent oligopeptide transporter, POT family
VLFLSHSLGFSDDQAVAIYSYFTSAAYFSPLIGGYLSDSYFGKYKVSCRVDRESCVFTLPLLGDRRF